MFRHAESEKNLKNIHGGIGLSLTHSGIESLNALTKKDIFKNIETPCLITGGVSQHIIETGKILGNSLGLNTEFFPSFQGIHLGVLHGISEKEAKLLYPNDYKNLMLWANRQLNIQDVSIFKMEKIEDFRERVINQLLELKKKYNTIIFIGSRSTLILLKNILVMKKDFNWVEYKAYNFDYLEAQACYLEL